MHHPHSYNQSFLYPFVLFPPFFSLSLSFISFTFSLFLPLFLTPSHPTQPLSASLRRFFFFPTLDLYSWSNSMYTPGCRGNRRRPHERVDEQKTQRPSSTERVREREMESERERERGREKENQISFLGEGFGVCGK